MKFREYRILWRGEAHVVHASVEPSGRVQVASLHTINARDVQTFVDGEAVGEGSEAEALSALTPDERSEIFSLVREAASRG